MGEQEVMRSIMQWQRYHPTIKVTLKINGSSYGSSGGMTGVYVDGEHIRSGTTLLKQLTAVESFLYESDPSQNCLDSCPKEKLHPPTKKKRSK